MSSPTHATQRSRLAATAYFVALAGALIAAGGIAGVQLALWPPLAAFLLFALGAGVFGFLAMNLGAVSVIRTRARFGPEDRRRSVTAASTGVALVAVLLLAALGGAGKPRINDISTDLVDPPAFVAAGSTVGPAPRDMSYPPAFAPVVEQFYPEVRPIELSAPPEQAYARAVASARELGWRITREDPAAGSFEATETSTVFRFVDDVAVRVRPEGDGARIDVRSKSRDGQGDLGANAERIQRFAAEIKLPPVAAK
jgi:hypothetical protein